MGSLHITQILDGTPGISPVEGANLEENCIVALHKNGHLNPVLLGLIDSKQESVPLYWEDRYNEQLERTYADIQSVTERAAVCVSILLALNSTDYTVIERSRKGTGFDYMLGDKNSEFYQPKARLEISGIYQETDSNSVEARFSIKSRQTDRSDATRLPAYISVVEFGTPKAKFGRKEMEV